jgi:alpha-glucosidase
MYSICPGVYSVAVSVFFAQAGFFTEGTAKACTLMSMSLPSNSHPTADGVHLWPEGSIVYHIYPRSFMDTNNDGIGDLRGIIDRLDYLASLHVNAIWLSPFYPSPMADFGYDISDYQDIDPIFGTMDDFRQLLIESHRRDIKLIIDLVPNHTSDEHDWFKQSISSSDNPYADWYIWRDARIDADGRRQVPNNWRDALTGGPAWEWNEQRQQFYLHSFHTKQPDLNWSNPVVREAIRSVMRYWLDLGVDGFRVDAVYWMGKDPLLTDDDYNPQYVEGEDLLYNALLHNNSQGWPTVYAYLSEMAEVLHEEAYKAQPRFMITEAYPERHNPLAAYMSFYVGVDPKVAAPFNFEGLSLPWEAGVWRHFLKGFHHALGLLRDHCIASYAFGNHDKPRLASRLGEDVARSAAVMQLTLPGMIFIYYGEEIGMHNVEIPHDAIRDPAARGDPLHGLGRDPARTPMQWTADTNAGFSGAKQTWLPLSPQYPNQNVQTEQQKHGSFYNLYRTLCRLRATSPSLRSGNFELLDVEPREVLGYMRSGSDEAYASYINFNKDSPVTFRPNARLRKPVISSARPADQVEYSDEAITLLPSEGVVFAV